MRPRPLPALAAALAAAVALPAAADPLTSTRTATVVSDPVGNATPRSLPGAVVDYRTRVTNPVGNAVATVRNVVLVEPIADTVVLRVADLGASGSGPVEFLDGSLLGIGLLSSGLAYRYSASAPTTDGLEFFDGTSWAYQPVPDAAGYDPNVRAMRVTLTSSFAAASTIQLRYRVKIK
jgi:hypothetical protein